MISEVTPEGDGGLAIPPAPKGEQWHKPEGLTPEDWRDGWRPLLVSELDGEPHKDIEWKGIELGWSDMEFGGYPVAIDDEGFFRTKRRLPGVPLPPLTHADLVDAFPCICGVRDGFEAVETADGPAPGVRIVNVQAFGAACSAKDGQVGQPHACACLVMILMGTFGIGFMACLNALDADHKAALARLIADVCERGVEN